MAWTKHGHHIPGSEMSEDNLPIFRMRCGGPGLCNACSKEASMYQNSVNKKENIGPDMRTEQQNNSIAVGIIST